MAAGFSPGGQDEAVFFNDCCGDGYHGLWGNAVFFIG
jgi:hypothetical protein